jgi:hypothetical protein
MYAVVYDLEPERFVSMLGAERIEPGVGCHLRAALFSSPLLGCGNQFCADSSAPVCGRNIPSFEVAYRTGGVATIGV